MCVCVCVCVCVRSAWLLAPVTRRQSGVVCRTHQQPVRLGRGPHCTQTLLPDVGLEEGGLEMPDLPTND